MAQEDMDRIDAYVATLGEVVAIADANDPAHDETKRQFHEVAHIGGDPSYWIGSEERLQIGDTGGLEPVFICFYTRDTAYEPLAMRLRDTLDAHGLDHQIVGIDSLGAWEHNCAYKARFVRDQWHALGRPIVWLDADATVESDPVLLRHCGADFAVCKYDGWEFGSGTLFFNATPAAGRLLDSWVARCEADPLIWDQMHLDAAWADIASSEPLITQWLPESYLHIFDEVGQSAPVITHWQASRENKALVSGGVVRPKPEIPEALKEARRYSRFHQARENTDIGTGSPSRVDQAQTDRPARSMQPDMLPRVDIIRAEEADWLLLNSPDHISDFIRKNGFWGRTEADICKMFIAGRSNCIVIDAGANIGGFTIPIAKILSESDGTLYAFEPQRIVHQQLCANIFMNRLNNVYTYNAAVGEVSEILSIPELDFQTSENIGGFSIDETIRENLRETCLKKGYFLNHSRNDIKQYRVEKIPLDMLEIFSSVAFIKVDVEGYELEFFQGAVETIRHNGFPPIVFELWEGMPWYEEKAQKTVKFLSDLGYRFEKFGREILAVHPAHPVQMQLDRNGGTLRAA
jgi:FkbM family methyltransferase